MNIQSILAVTDLSSEGNRTVVRAAMVAAQHRALLKIMYAPWDVMASGSAGVQEEVRACYELPVAISNGIALGSMRVAKTKKCNPLSTSGSLS